MRDQSDLIVIPVSSQHEIKCRRKNVFLGDQQTIEGTNSIDSIKVANNDDRVMCAGFNGSSPNHI
tara:strand:- start:28783 stop:28977 length:195 start_codon:yes stop_codon:yes gene_type:complete